MAGVAGPGLDLGAEAENELLRFAEARAGALLTRTLEQRRELIRKLQAILQTNERLDLTKEELKEILDGLGTYSDTIDDNGKRLLRYIIDQFPTSFTWVKTTMETESTSIIFLNIIRYFYKQLFLPILQKRLHVRSGELHIVLVGKGSYNDQVRPAEWLIPGDSITDTILYSPWNCRIDANVACGIATGDLQPQHRAFRNNQAPIMQQQVPDHWNSISDQHPQTVPEIILGPINSTADCITKITALANITLYNPKRFIIPYPQGGDLANWLPEIPLYQIIGAIEILLKIIPPHKATIHLAADLKYREPDVEMLNNQYAFTPDGTVMTTQDMQFTDPECPILYGLFDSMFRPPPHQ